MSERIRNNQVKSLNNIYQDEHQDSADAKRVIAVDEAGEIIDSDNPQPVLTSFIRNGAAQQVTEDTVDPTNNRPLPVKLTGIQGDVIIDAENLNLLVQTDGFYDPVDNPKPDSSAAIYHERGETQDRTKQNRRTTAIRGTIDSDTVSQDVSIHDHDGNEISDRNPIPVSTNYEKIVQVLLNSKWMDLAVYDEVVTVVSPDRTSINLGFKEDGALIGEAVINYVSDLSWSFELFRYLNDDDGTQLLDDDDTPLILE